MQRQTELITIMLTWIKIIAVWEMLLAKRITGILYRVVVLQKTVINDAASVLVIASEDLTAKLGNKFATIKEQLTVQIS